MSATTKHDFHPDAESLNAFAEQALSERERGDVLAHLAACGRCRQIVALAREAADPEVTAAAAARHAIVHSDSWWEKWRLVWVPSAVVTAFAAASISVYIHQVDQSRAAIRIAEQKDQPNRTAPAYPSQPQQAEAVPPSSLAPAAPPAKAEKPVSPSAPPKLSSRTTAVTPAAPPAPGAMQQSELEREGLVPAPGAEGRGSARMGQTPAKPSAASEPTPAGRAFSEEQKKQDDRMRMEEERQQVQMAQSSMPPPSLEPPNAPATISDAPGSPNAKAPDSNQQVVVRSDSLAGFSSIRSSRSMAKIAAAEAAINLPSGLPAISTAAGAHRMLAIDKTGALFLSEDAGNSWVRVLQQWTGHAVSVRRHIAPGALAAAPAAAQPEAVPGISGGAPADASPALFEILNDKDQMWLSTDGRLWIAK